jgi:hypothetical protein
MNHLNDNSVFQYLKEKETEAEKGGIPLNDDDIKEELVYYIDAEDATCSFLEFLQDIRNTIVSDKLFLDQTKDGRFAQRVYKVIETHLHYICQAREQKAKRQASVLDWICVIIVVATLVLGVFFFSPFFENKKE